MKNLSVNLKFSLALRGVVVASALIFACANTASAVSLDNAVSARSDFVFPNGNVNSSSYDSAGFDAFQPFSSFTSGGVSQLSSFDGGARGSRIEVTLLSEVACYDGTMTDSNGNLLANNFGLVNSDGTFSSLIDTAGATPGFTTEFTVGSDEELTFALQTPQSDPSKNGVFSTIDADNTADGGAAHILVQEVTKEGLASINPTDIRGNGPLGFQLREGDLILYMEDMLGRNNVPGLLVPELSDFDYNDMVVVVRQSEVPEPQTVMLLMMALLFAAYRRKSAPQVKSVKAS